MSSSRIRNLGDDMQMGKKVTGHGWITKKETAGLIFNVYNEPDMAVRELKISGYFLQVWQPVFKMTSYGSHLLALLPL